MMSINVGAFDWVELKRLAEAASPGPWHTDRYHAFVWGSASEMIADSRVEGAPKLVGQAPVIRARGVGGGLPIADNIKFVAAANPAAVLALLAERDEARRNACAWQSAAHTAGQYREQERSRAEKAEAERDAYRSEMQAASQQADMVLARAEHAEAEHAEAIARGNDWCDQAQKARAERDAAKLQTAEAVVALNNRDRERMQAEREARAAEAERDVERANAETLNAICQRAEAERDRLRAERDRLWEALRLTTMLVEQIMVAIDADPAQTFLSVKIQPNGAEVKRITVAECLDKARAALGIEEAGHD
jgi:hypothetical protein